MNILDIVNQGINDLQREALENTVNDTVDVDRVKRSADVMESQTTKKRKTMLGVHWRQKQQETFDESTGVETYFVKQGQFKFGSFPSKGAFIDTYLASHAEKLPIYELITNGPCALYFDVEQKFDSEPSTTFIQQWLIEFIRIVQSKLTTIVKHEDDIKSITISNDCRASSNGYKLSFHLTFDRIIFDNNHTSMKQFVLNKIKPTFDGVDAYNWTEVMKNGPMKKISIDLGVYTKNRAFRVAYGSKDGKTCLLPWNVDTMTKLEVDKDWFYRSLIANKVTNDDNIISYQETLKMVETIPIIVEDCNNDQERALCKQLVPILSQQRSEGSHGWDTWAKVGWAISDVFKKDDEGRTLFHTFSKRAQNYDRKATDLVYDSSNGRTKFGSIVVWARADDGDAANDILQHKRPVESKDTMPNKLDESCHSRYNVTIQCDLATTIGTRWEKTA
jgi:hypothetical protein